jgi:hypothetical protein
LQEDGKNAPPNGIRAARRGALNEGWRHSGLAPVWRSSYLVSQTNELVAMIADLHISGPSVVIAIFIILGIYVNVLYHFRYLVRTADRYPLDERRRRAGRMSFAIILLFAFPAAGAVFGCVYWNLGDPRLVVVMDCLAIGPAAIVWFRRIPRIYALGYRQ